MTTTCLGILAGMGPKSTAPFVDAVIDACQTMYNARDDEDFPPMMIYSLPTPFYMDRPINHERMQQVIREGLQKLESTGVDVIAMPCNSAHIYFDFLKAGLSVPLLHIVEETVKYLPTQLARVTLLATPTTVDSGLYQAGIVKAGHELILHEEWQTTVNQLIQGIKAGTSQTELLARWEDLLEELRQEAVSTIMTACTDLNVITDRVQTDITIVDSTRCLAQALVREYLHREEGKRSNPPKS